MTRHPLDRISRRIADVLIIATGVAAIMSVCFTAGALSFRLLEWLLG